MRSNTFAVPVAVCAVLLGLTACGQGGAGSAKPAASPSSAAADPYSDLISIQSPSGAVGNAYAETGLTRTKKLHMKMSGARTVVADLSFDYEGDCAGTIEETGIGTMEVFANSKFAYIKSSEAYVRGSLAGSPKAEVDQAVARLAGHWVKMDIGETTVQIVAASCRLDDPRDSLGVVQPAAQKGPDSTVDGQPVATYTYPAATGGTATDFVAKQGRPYLLKHTQGKPEELELVYSAFDTKISLIPPADTEIINAPNGS